MPAEPKIVDQNAARGGLTSLGSPPPFFSLSFHTHFLPSVLVRRYRLCRIQEKAYRSPFASYVPLEPPLAVMICIVFIAIGIPRLLGAHKILGGILAGAGVAGILAMFVSSVRTENRWRAQTGRKYTYDDFVVPVFIFFLLSGITAGLSISYLTGATHLALWYGVAGALIGYVVGVFSSVLINYLGWIGAYVCYLFIAVSIGMVLFDAIIVFLLLH